MHDFPLDAAVSGVGTITATGVAGIGLDRSTYGFAQRAAGVQISGGFRAVPWFKPYSTFWLVNQYTSERLAPRLSITDGRPDTIFNYADWPRARSIGVELGHWRGGALDIRLTNVASTFRKAEYHKDTLFTPNIDYAGRTVSLGFIAPFDGYWQHAVSSPTSYSRALSVVEENDAFGGTSDSSYTQGLRVAWDVGVWPTSGKFGSVVRAIYPFLSGSVLLPGSHAAPAVGCDTAAARPCGIARFAVGQTIYTPPVLIDTAIDVRTRPYAGYLFASVTGIEMFKQQLVSSELQIGVLGQAAAARSTQSFAHWANAWYDPRPLGWANQLRDRLQASLDDSYGVKLLEFCVNDCDGSRQELRLFDLNPNADVLLGWPITRASAGATARVGFGFPDLQGQHRIPVTARDTSSGRWHNMNRDAMAVARHFWFDFFFNVEERYVATNTLIAGTSADDFPGGWGTLREIRVEPHVDEYAGGVAFGLSRIVVSYQRATRSSEFQPSGGIHRFGSVTISLQSLGGR